MHNETDFYFALGHRAWRRTLQAGCLCILLCALAPAQTVTPVIDENIVKGPGGKAKGKIEYVNNSLQELAVTLDTQSFTVSDTGEIAYRPLDPGVHVKYSATSFRIPPKQSYLVFYEAQADAVPSWFVVYATFAGFKERTSEGLNIHVLLPHTVYLLPKGEVKQGDLAIKTAEFLPTEKKIVLRVENAGPAFGRILQTDIGSGKDKVTSNGFPVFPHGQRQVEIPWTSSDAPKKVTLHLEHFFLEEPIRIVFP
jgi:hypothetical protein